MATETWDTAFAGSEDKKEEKTDFVKFPEGITRLRVVDMNIHTRWVHWANQFQRSINCPGSSKCQICTIRKAAKAANETQKYGLSKRFAINVLNRETKQYEILDQGKEFFEDLRMVRATALQPSIDDETGDQKPPRGELTGFDIKVRRTGLKQDDTKYRVDPDRKYALTDEDKEQVTLAKDLNEYFKPHTPEQIARLLAGEAWNDVMATDNTASVKDEVVVTE
jgi:hypothetical protein